MVGVDLSSSIEMLGQLYKIIDTDELGVRSSDCIVVLND